MSNKHFWYPVSLAIVTGIFVGLGLNAIAIAFGLIALILAIDGHCITIKAALEK